MNDIFIHSFSPLSELVSISSGVLDAKRIEVRLKKSFIKARLEIYAFVNVFETIPRTNLCTFSRLIKSATKVKGSNID